MIYTIQMKKTSNTELLILRHGKSNWNTNESDFYRPLKKRGKKNARQIGLWIAKQKRVPDLLISSPAMRAIDTAKIAAQAMKVPTSTIQTDQRIYEADASDLCQLLSETPDTIQRLMIIGHNPALEELLRYLAPDIPIPENGKLLPTATLARLQLNLPFNQLFNQRWVSLNGNSLISYTIQRPKDLPA